MPPKPHRPFRILALPLARLPGPVTSVPPKPKTPLILYQVLQPERPSSKSTTTAGTGTGAEADAKQPPKEPLLNRALARASDEWLKLGTKPAGSWMLWFYQRGESLMDRIEYEEWALKSIQEGRGVRINKEGQPEERIEIPLLKPELEPPLPTLIPKLHRLLMHRIPYHRKMMWRSLAFSPVTWPFALIPIIPNFPLFYVLWRAWSHWKAYRGATYLEQLLKSGLIVEKPSPELTEVYRSRGIVVPSPGEENAAPDSTTSGSGSSTPGNGSVRLSNSGEADAGVELEGKEAEKQGLPLQARGESQGAADGTSTPKEMVYTPPAGVKKTDTSSKPSSSSVIPITGSTTAPRPRHPSLLLRPNQVPILAQAFALRPSELNDINRAVEQADQRARKADEEAEGKGKGGEGGNGEKKQEQPGTQWRGNLHR